MGFGEESRLENRLENITFPALYWLNSYAIVI